ncbi:hypothetical protein DAI22_08g016200 [Oryza sativa Japonica Group]|uniref:cDNA clone:J013006G19, full insert sequence n=1 Tax=Oryza sativa subsp. japonica TaxID=39947 RepID=B7EP19_ORYSJ|nr:hypothetical protein DAI22_08g016200 [Oryza sativa Japonica Group]KAF2917878.1 hypothetical protein DAI22_08g016200 [Oryza sativa Japonica Group]BAG94116.1 unnamed protein product [Oryza sativa Japonica Group]
MYHAATIRPLFCFYPPVSSWLKVTFVMNLDYHSILKISLIDKCTAMFQITFYSLISPNFPSIWQFSWCWFVCTAL